MRFVRYDRAATGLLVLGALLGCQRTRVAEVAEPFQPEYRVKAAPKSAARSEDSKTAVPWYQELGEDLSARRAEVVDLPETLRHLAAVKPPPGPPPPAGPAGSFLAEARARIEERRPRDAPWRLLRLELSNVVKKGELRPQLVVDLGLVKFYSRLPEIAVERCSLEQCLSRLARQAGLRYAQPVRVHNPLVTWRKTDASLYDAIQAIAAEQGFAARFSEVGRRIQFYFDEYPDRERLLEEVAERTVEAGGALARGFPAVVVEPAGKPAAVSVTPPAPEPKSVPAPPPAPPP